MWLHIVCVCVAVDVEVHTRQCGFLSSNSRALDGAVNKRFSVSPKWEVPLLIRELKRRAGERETTELEAPMWVSTKVAVE